MKTSEITRDPLTNGGYVLLQPRHGYRFSLDAVLLASFVALKPSLRIVDFGCGSGVLPLLLLSREATLNITGIERMDKPYALAKQNVRENQVAVEILQGDVCLCREFLPCAFADAIVTNPPFYPVSACRLPQNQEIAAAKTELFWDQEKMLEEAYALLKDSGSLFMIFPGERKEEMIALGKARGFSLKRRCLVFSKAGDRVPRRVLLEFSKAPVLKTAEEVLQLYNAAGETSPAMKRILAYYDGTGTIPCGDSHRKP